MTYVDFEYYSGKYFGILNKEKFNQLAVKASREVDNNINTELTEQEISNLSDKAQDKLKYTTCALIDLINRKEISENRKVDSISIDGVSKHYSSINADEYKKIKKDILDGLPNELTRYF